MEYKVETKPSLWHVTLVNGCYSDRTEQHLFFAGNTHDEIWAFLLEYKKKELACDVSYWGDYAGYGLIYGERREIVKSGKHEFDWDTGYGGAWDVDIKRLDVIYFQ